MAAFLVLVVMSVACIAWYQTGRSRGYGEGIDAMKSDEERLEAQTRELADLINDDLLPALEGYMLEGCSNANGCDFEPYDKCVELLAKIGYPHDVPAKFQVHGPLHLPWAVNATRVGIKDTEG